MSKFIDKIKRITNNTAAPIGFTKPAIIDELPPILLVFDFSSFGAKKSRDISSVDIDAAIINISGIDVASFVKQTKSLGDLPFGVYWDNGFKGDISGFIGAGCDFVIFDLNTNVNMVDNEGLGRILRINKSLTPGMIKAINDLNLTIDCILMNNDKNKIDLELLLSSHQFVEILNKPMIVNAEKTVTVSELSELNIAGIHALILSTEISLEELKELRKTILMIPKTTRKKTSGRALIPTISSTMKKEEAEEVEEDDDDI